MKCPLTRVCGLGKVVDRDVSGPVDGDCMGKVCCWFIPKDRVSLSFGDRASMGNAKCCIDGKF